MEHKVCISYCWKEPSNGIVCNWLCKCLERNRISYSIDKDECNYNDSIEHFERKIGDSEEVIIVVGNYYLLSENCMYEASRIVSKGDLKNRIRIVCLDDFSRDHNTFSRLISYWECQRRTLEVKVEGVSSPARKPFENALARINLIIENIGEFWAYITDHNTLGFSSLSKNDFAILTDYINRNRKNVELDDGLPILEQVMP